VGSIEFLGFYWVWVFLWFLVKPMFCKKTQLGFLDFYGFWVIRMSTARKILSAVVSALNRCVTQPDVFHVVLRTAALSVRDLMVRQDVRRDFVLYWWNDLKPCVKPTLLSYTKYWWQTLRLNFLESLSELCHVHVCHFCWPFISLSINIRDTRNMYVVFNVVSSVRNHFYRKLCLCIWFLS